MHGMVRSWFGGTGGSVRQDTTIRISSVNNIQFLGTVNCCSPGAAWRLIQVTMAHLSIETHGDLGPFLETSISE